MFSALPYVPQDHVKELNSPEFTEDETLKSAEKTLAEAGV
jgi:hypothetical protein